MLLPMLHAGGVLLPLRLHCIPASQRKMLTSLNLFSAVAQPETHAVKAVVYGRSTLKVLINWAVNIAGYYGDENTSLKNRIGAEMCHSDLQKCYKAV